VTDAAVQRLQQALPHTTVTHRTGYLCGGIIR
jgi:hypothetical protein